MNKDWFDNYFKEQWVTVEDCDIDFEKLEPISTANSLHVFEERYEINGNQYRLLYAIGDTSNTPTIEILNKNDMDKLKFTPEMINDLKNVKGFDAERIEAVEVLAWQLFQDITGISFKRKLTPEEKKSVTDIEAYQQYRVKAEKLYAKRLAKREKSMSNKRYPVIEVPASGNPEWGGGAYVLCFVYSKYKGNFVLKGYLKEVKEYLKKNYTHYFYNMSLWHHGNNRDIWGFWKEDMGIFEPHRDSKMHKGKSRWNFQVRPYTKWHESDEEYEKGEEQSLWFKRMPKQWIPEFDNF